MAAFSSSEKSSTTTFTTHLARGRPRIVPVCDGSFEPGQRKRLQQERAEVSKQQIQSRAKLLLVSLGLLIVLFSGCKRGNGLPMVRVSGKVTFAGGPCPAPGNVTFTPIEVD